MASGKARMKKVRGQYTEADRALCGRGDLQLVPAYAKHRVTVDTWKTKLFERFRLIYVFTNKLRQ